MVEPIEMGYPAGTGILSTVLMLHCPISLALVLGLWPLILVP
jgi:hypothetical protein